MSAVIALRIDHRRALRRLWRENTPPFLQLKRPMATTRRRATCSLALGGMVEFYHWAKVTAEIACLP